MTCASWENRGWSRVVDDRTGSVWLGDTGLAMTFPAGGDES